VQATVVFRYLGRNESQTQQALAANHIQPNPGGVLAALPLLAK